MLKLKCLIEFWNTLINQEGSHFMLKNLGIGTFLVFLLSVGRTFSLKFLVEPSFEVSGRTFSLKYLPREAFDC